MPHGVERTRQRCTLRTSGQARVLGPRRGIGASDSVVGTIGGRPRAKWGGISEGG